MNPCVEIDREKNSAIAASSVLHDSSPLELFDYPSRIKNLQSYSYDVANSQVTTKNSRKGIYYRMVSLALFVAIVLFLYFVTQNIDSTHSTPVKLSPMDLTKAHLIIDQICKSVSDGFYRGDFCDFLCSVNRNWSLVDFHQGGSKNVIKIHESGKDIILKTHHQFAYEYNQLHDLVSESDFTDSILNIVNEHMHLDWPARHKFHLLRKLWPYHRHNSSSLSNAERNSLWALLQQDEYINLRLLTISQVVPQVLGTCGHIYRPEYLVVFKMKPYYLSLRAKILVHLMGTLKLFDEFLNEPLQWCDVKFENLGLSADYPKRFVVLDSDMLFTESKLNALLMSTPCKNDSECTFFDCESTCLLDTGHCSSRINENIDVFCKKLVKELFGNFLPKSNRYLTACSEEAAKNRTKRLNDLREAWIITLSDI